MNKVPKVEKITYIAQDKPWPREYVLTLLETAIGLDEIRFAREVALSWLATYPGDLEVSLYNARILIEENHPHQAIKILETLCHKDPEFLEAQKLLHKVHSEIQDPSEGVHCGCEYALDINHTPKGTLPKWSRPLRKARLALDNEVTPKAIDNAERMVQAAIAKEPPTPLVEVTHLRLLTARKTVPPGAIRSLAELYHKRWPECISIFLVLADILMKSGKSDKAVALLHRAATQDVVGVVATRLWGSEHPYRALWPETLEAYINLPLPAAVISAFGWNRLPEGEKKTEYLARNLHKQDLNPKENSEDSDELDLKAEKKSRQEKLGSQEIDSVPETLRSVKAELERVANRLDQPELARSDGRFPVYVVFTTKSGLIEKYGEEATEELHDAMRDLVISVRSRKDWGAIQLYADDTTSMASFGLLPVKQNDPWALKLAIADLDASLGKQGAMIGALLIVGGPDVVPFHYLPNPTDDVDDDVPSDNPYSTCDENYFIPDWGVGRLPGGSGNDPKPLIQTLAHINAYHQAEETNSRNWLWQWLYSFIELFRPPIWRQRSSFGYSAEAWRKASWQVFRPIGEPRDLITSPPEGIDIGTIIPASRMSYFNLHGLVDSAQWFGQRDPLASSDGQDYPIALRPQDVINSGRAPSIVFSEACYGANIIGKNIDEAIALKFLTSGSQAVVGSTVMSYGSINAPLIAADLLGHYFWNYLREDYPAGEALRRAKIHLAKEMHHRQGYLDGEDQKTLISFILYGDPLAQSETAHKNNIRLRELLPFSRSSRKSVVRILHDATDVRTVCDRSDMPGTSEPIPPEVMTHVKQVVAQYLPGMAGAQFTLSHEHSTCHGGGHNCPTAQLVGNYHPKGESLRQVVVLSKQLVNDQHTHHQIARLRLDRDGKVVKLAVSR
ncbi:MAG: C25 family cysteine peptidase [Anaerolineales bacterium]|jgi:hypothetical protein